VERRIRRHKGNSRLRRWRADRPSSSFKNKNAASPALWTYGRRLRSVSFAEHSAYIGAPGEIASPARAGRLIALSRSGKAGRSGAK
jgi:hypothetical protein